MPKILGGFTNGAVRVEVKSASEAWKCVRAYTVLKGRQAQGFISGQFEFRTGGVSDLSECLVRGFGNVWMVIEFGHVDGKAVLHDVRPLYDSFEIAIA